MPLDRRQFIQLMAGSAAASMLTTFARAQAVTKHNIKAIAFDGFPIFDPRPIFGLAKTLYPEQGAALAKLWFAKIFGYTWLRTIGAHYKGFYAVIQEALIFSAGNLKLDLPPHKQKQLMDIWLNLKVWPDVKPALALFKKNNIRLGFLSNLSEEMLRTNAKNSGIEEAFEFYLSTDKVQAYKPSPLAYQMAIKAFALPKEEIAFTAFAGWDATGAKWFGYPTVWINRLDAPVEELGVRPDSMGKSMDYLVNFVLT
ncbi:MAG: haloacid dehalogenase type II [Gammaproteobacteria bacterium]|nr:haloacid dehalogenase type II [Gammaproteobacteria bacterium]